MTKMTFFSWLPSLVIPLLLTMFGAGSLAAAEPAGDEAVDTTVMSFNIRYGGADDGPDSWPFRRDLVFSAIALHQPDIFGVQECLLFQGEELSEAFAEYQMTGVGRDDGQMAGEMCAIFFKRDRYELLDQGTFWLSETPEVVGSKGWDAALPRIASWVCLLDGGGASDTLYVFNAHFDHIGALAREKSAELLRFRLASIAAGHPVILMGDFNDPASPSSPSYRTLVAEGGQAGLTLQDTWFWASRDQRMQGEDTFHGFSGKPTRGRIDWILATGHWQGVGAGIERHQENGRYPSDHFPVWATFLPPLKEPTHGQGN